MPKPVLREVLPVDYDRVVELAERNGLGAEGSKSRWDWLWKKNPATIHLPNAPAGWVLDHGGLVCGYLGNICGIGWLNSQMIRVAAAHKFVVDPSYRGHSLRLAAAFFSQPDADLLLNTSANAAAGAAFGLCKAKHIPQPDYGNVLFWVIRPRAVLQAYLRKRGHNPWLAAVGGAILAPLAATDNLIREIYRPQLLANIDIKLLNPEQIGPEFDNLWHATVKRYPERLLLERSAETLRWHFRSGSNIKRRVYIVTAWQKKLLLGYAVVTREDSTWLELNRSRISDLQVIDGNPFVIDQLLAAAHENASKTGSDTLEMIGFPQSVRQRFLAGKPHIYRLPHWPYWYKARDTKLAAAIALEGSWYGSPYDGDATL